MLARYRHRSLAIDQLGEIREGRPSCIDAPQTIGKGLGGHQMFERHGELADADPKDVPPCRRLLRSMLTCAEVTVTPRRASDEEPRAAERRVPVPPKSAGSIRPCSASASGAVALCPVFSAGLETVLDFVHQRVGNFDASLLERCLNSATWRSAARQGCGPNRPRSPLSSPFVAEPSLVPSIEIAELITSH